MALGQEENLEQPKKKKDFRPLETKLAVNAIRAGRTLGNSNLTTHEIEGAVTFYRYDLVLDFGTEKNQYGDTYNYENKGYYYRIGIDRNFVKDASSGNVLSLGLRYCRASFEDALAYTTDLGFGEQTYSFANSDLTARWMEVAFGLRGKIVSNLYMGFTMRWQFMRKLNGAETLEPYDIPGFGKTKRRNSTGFDYYLAWRIPFRK